MPFWYRLAARVRGVGWVVGWAAFVGGTLARIASVGPEGTASTVVFAGVVLVAVSIGLGVALGAPRMRRRDLAPPVRGRWVALNSPANRVPSHRTHGHGQTFAIDLVLAPGEGRRPDVTSRPFIPPAEFPGFGEEIVAPAAGRVVKVVGSMRDHRSRTTADALRFLKLEGFLRGLAGTRFLAGNHIVLDLGDGAYAFLAHLKRGSARVRRGQEVEEGDLLALCGNSGNSSEPHLHFQLMDHPLPIVAAGVPFSFDGGLPRNGETMEAATDDVLV